MTISPVENYVYVWWVYIQNGAILEKAFDLITSLAILII